MVERSRSGLIFYAFKPSSNHIIRRVLSEYHFQPPPVVIRKSNRRLNYLKQKYKN